MIQINLLPDIKIEYLRAQSSKQRVTAAAITITGIALAISGLLLFYAYVIQAAQIAVLSKSIETNYAMLNKVQDLDKYLTVQNQLAALPGLHAEKGAVSRLKNYLTALNPSAPNNVSLNSVSVESELKVIKLQGNAASFQSFNVFVDTLRNAQVEYGTGQEKNVAPMFEALTIESSNIASDKGDDVTFSLSLTYNEIIFDAKEPLVAPKIPTKTTTQSITNSPSVFSAPEGGN